ncbi:MAG TPA: hypothetical protein VF221_13055 [Chloroflexota bacterium]
MATGVVKRASAIVRPSGGQGATTGWKERKETIGLTFFWLVVLAYAYFIPSSLDWNTESHLYTTFAIVDHHTLSIDRYQVGLGDKSYARGHYYSDKAPGLAFMAVPIYAALRLALPSVQGHSYILYKHLGYYMSQEMVYLRYAITYLLVIMPSAAMVWLLWLFLAGISGNTGWSMLLAGVYALGTIAYVYSTWFFSHQIAAILLFSSFLLLYMHMRGKRAGPRQLLFTALAGLLAGAAIVCEYPTAVIAACIGGYLLAVTRDRIPAALAYVAGMVPPAILAVTYNILAFGKPFATGYNYVNSSWYHSNVHGGLFGLGDPASYGVRAPSLYSLWQITFGSYRGIFLISPVLLLAVAGAFFMWRRRDIRPEFWLCVIVVVLYFLVDASRGLDQNGWSGGSSVASRHLTPMLPFMIIPIVFGFRNRWFRVLFLILGAISVAIVFTIISTSGLFTFSDQNPLMNEAFPDFIRGRIGANWVATWFGAYGITGFASLVPLLLVIGVLTARLRWLFRPDSASRLSSDGSMPQVEAS